MNFPFFKFVFKKYSNKNSTKNMLPKYYDIIAGKYLRHNLWSNLF